MSQRKQKSGAQLLFLRKCTENPYGLAREDWPSPVVFRRWMRKPGFRVAMAAVQDALRFQADLHLSAAAAAAAKTVASVLASDQPDRIEQITAAKDPIQSLLALLRLAHLRQRFPIEIAAPRERIQFTPEQKEIIAAIKEWVNSGVHKRWTMEEAGKLLNELHGIEPDADWTGKEGATEMRKQLRVEAERAAMRGSLQRPVERQPTRIPDCHGADEEPGDEESGDEEEDGE